MIKKTLLIILAILSTIGIAHAATGDLLIGTNNPSINTRLPIGTNGYYLKSDGTTPSWQPVAGGGGSGGGTWGTTTSSVPGRLINYSLNNTDIVTVGNTSTTTAPIFLDPNTKEVRVNGSIGTTSRPVNYVNASNLTVGSLNGVIVGTSGVFGVGTNGIDYTKLTSVTCSSGSALTAFTAAGVGTCGNAFSTTSAAYWLTQQTTDNLTQGSTNKYYSNAQVDAHLSGTSPIQYSAGVISCPTCITSSGVTAVNATYPIISSGGNTPTISTAISTSSLIQVGTTSVASITALPNLSITKSQVSDFGGPYVPTSRTITINGTTLDLSVDRSWTVSGGSGGSGTWSTTTSSVPGELLNYSNNSTDIAILGASATTSANQKIYLDPNSQTIGVGNQAWLYNTAALYYPSDGNHFQLTDLFNNLYIKSKLSANGSFGNSGDVLTSQGGSSNAIWKSIAGYPFQVSGNATSTITQFNGGLTSYASTTIGDGTGLGGLTVNGWATTTGGLTVSPGSSGSTAIINVGISGGGVYQVGGKNVVSGGQLYYPESVTNPTLTDISDNLYARNDLKLSKGIQDKNLTKGASSTVLVSDATNALWQKLATSQLTNDSGFITSSSIPPYIFPLSNNATSTLTQFNGGITAYASSTIGNGTVAGGLTIAGTASTTALKVNNIPVYGTFDKSILIGSSTPDSNYKTFSSATSTFNVWNPYHNIAGVQLYCKTTNGGVTVEMGNGSATTTAVCTTSGVSSASSVTWSAGSNVTINVGNITSAANSVTITGTFNDQ